MLEKSTAKVEGDFLVIGLSLHPAAVINDA